ncbi:hypothetical protein TUM17576_11780 [Enterobacter hormaechei]|nr:hypothetical protein TUM17576_11780 [Enterobacter hormaechei]
MGAKQSIICINGMRVIKYDYTDAELAHVTLEIAVKGKQFDDKRFEGLREPGQYI